MNSSFGIQINRSFGTNNSNKNKRGLTAQEEYWLNRILRQYSTPIFIIIILSIVMIGILTVASIIYPSDPVIPPTNSINKVNIINVSTSTTINNSTSTSSSKIEIIRK